MTSEPIKALSAFLSSWCVQKDLSFNVPGNTKLCVMPLNTDQYKRKPFLGGEELMFQSCRAGAKGDPIFVFEPADAQDYSVMETTLAKADTELPGFADMVIELATDNGMQGAVNLKRAVEHLTKHAIALKDQIETAEKARQLKTDATTYSDNELFGLF